MGYMEIEMSHTTSRDARRTCHRSAFFVGIRCVLMKTVWTPLSPCNPLNGTTALLPAVLMAINTKTANTTDSHQRIEASMLFSLTFPRMARMTFRNPHHGTTPVATFYDGRRKYGIGPALEDGGSWRAADYHRREGMMQDLNRKVSEDTYPSMPQTADRHKGRLFCCLQHRHAISVLPIR